MAAVYPSRDLIGDGTGQIIEDPKAQPLIRYTIK